MKIAIIGWGSLIWHPRNLPLATGWQMGGPVLPIEFSRISSSGALTLVIDPNNGREVTTLYTSSQRTDLRTAIHDLTEREETSKNFIGYVDLYSNNSRSSIYADAEKIIRTWAETNDFSAVIWTDLYSNFEEKTGHPFTVENAISYLHLLDGRAAGQARQYINNSPQIVVTPVRERLKDDPWLIASDPEDLIR